MTLLDNRVLGELEEELLGAGILELDGGFGVLARTFYLDNGSDAETLVLDGVAHLQADVADGGLRTWCLLTNGHEAGLGVGDELGGYGTGILHARSGSADEGC